MAEGAFNQLIQICPNDGPPFLDIIRVYRKAATSLGLGGADFFLSPREPSVRDGVSLGRNSRRTRQDGSSLHGKHDLGGRAGSRNDSALGFPGGEDPRYLNCENLKDTATLAARLRQALPETSNSLVLCHRYRAYKAFLATGQLAVRELLPVRGLLSARGLGTARGPGTARGVGAARTQGAARVVAIAHEYGFFRRRRRRWAQRLSRHDVIFAGVSPGVAQELKQATGSALFWPNALDLDAWDPLNRSAARQALGLPPEGLVFGVVGRLHYKKRPELALQAFRLFLQRTGRRDAHLAFVGDGALRERLELASANLPVTFTGFTPLAAELMKAFDALLMASSNEPFGMVLLEAMAAGIPVIAPRQPGPLCILADLGHYFEGSEPQAIAAAMQAALEAPAGNGPERAQQKFSVAAVAQRIQALRQDLVETHPISPAQ